MTRARSLIFVATALAVAAAMVWAAPPKGPSGATVPNPSGATVPNPNVTVPNPNVTVPNPGGTAPAAPGPPTVDGPNPFVRPGTRLWLYRYGPFGYGYGNGYGGYSTVRYYVVAEKRGPDITWSVFTSTHDAYSRSLMVRAEANQVARSNALARREITDLRKQESALKAELSRVTDDGKRQEITGKLNALGKSIAEREAVIRPEVRGVVAGPFDGRRLDNYLMRIEKEAWDARMKAGVPMPPPAAPAPAPKGY